MARWLRHLPTLFVGLGVIFFVVHSEINFANHKPLWNDEGQELTVSCAVPASHLLLAGASPQPSPQPLYYLLLKAMVSRLSLEQNALIKFRAISLCASAVCLCLFFLVFYFMAGPAPAFLALASLCSQEIFHHYAAEDRPYMLWLMLLTALLFTAARLGAKPWGKVTAREKTFLVTLGFLLTFEVGPGMLQYAAVAAGLGICWNRKKINKKYLKLLMTTTALFLLLGWFYSRNFIHDTPIRELDLALTHDWGLVTKVLELLFPPHLEGACFKSLALLGLALPLILWKKRAKQPLLFSTSVIAALQVLIAVPIAGLVIWHHYFFAERVFIFLVVCQAFLVACGAWFLVEWFATRPRLAPFFALIPALGVVALSLEKTSATIKYNAAPSVALRDAEKIPCKSLRNTLKFYRLPKRRGFELGPNLLAALADRLEECRWRENGSSTDASSTYVVAQSYPFNSVEQSVQITSTLPPGAIPFQLCGKPIELSPNASKDASN